MRTALAAVLLLLLSAVSVAAQATTCDSATPSGVVVDPNTMLIRSTMHNSTDVAGNPVITSYEVAYFLQGADPTTGQVQQGPSTLQKASFAAVAGSADCYSVALPLQVPTIGQTQPLVAAVRSKNATLASVWVTSNPFGKALSVLPALARLLVVR